MVEHQQPLHHIVQGRVEAEPVRVQFASGLLAFLRQMQLGQGDRARSFRLQLRGVGGLKFFIPMQMANGEHDDPGYDQFQQQGSAAEDAYLRPPDGKDRVHGVRDGDHQRIMGQTMWGDQSAPAVEQAVLHDGAVIDRCMHSREVGSIAECLTDHGIDMRITCQEDAVTAIKRKRAFALQCNRGKELFKIGGFDRGNHDADQSSVGGIESACNIDRPYTASFALRRRAYEQGRRIRSELRLDEVPIGVIDPGRRPRAGEVEPSAVLVEQSQCRDMGHAGDTILEVLV